MFFNCTQDGVLPISVAVFSLLRSADPTSPLSIYIAHDAGFVARGAPDRIREIVARFPFASVHFVNIEPLLERHRETLTAPKMKWPLMVWAWCFCTELFPEVTGNLVFLDWDTLVFQDLAPLYDMDLAAEGMIEAAVSESPREHRPYLVAAGWPESAGPSINYGVQVIDTEAYRREHVKERMLEWYAKYKSIAVCAEQDALNAVCGDRIKRIPIKYNFYASWIDRIPKHNPFNPRWRIHATRDVLEGAAHPAIVHFIGHKKPWLKGYRSFRRDYRRIMRELGWMGKPIPGEGPIFRFIGLFADAYHGLLRKYAALQLRLLYR